MRDVLPQDILDKIGQQFFNAIRSAEPQYQNYQADEDAITGALGGSMDQTVRGSMEHGRYRYTWKTRTVKLRGRGYGAPEREYGADAIIELEVFDEQENAYSRKLLPFQAKKAGRINNQSLEDQSTRLNRLPGGGLVVVYSPQGYECAPSKALLDTHGSWNQLLHRYRRDFAGVVQNEFLECTVGSRSLYYDAERERMVMQNEDGTSQDIRFSVRSRTKTIIRRESRE